MNTIKNLTDAALAEHIGSAANQADARALRDALIAAGWGNFAPEKVSTEAWNNAMDVVAHTADSVWFLADGEIEVVADWRRAEALVSYRLLGDEKWLTTGRQVADVGGREGAIHAVNALLEG